MVFAVWSGIGDEGFWEEEGCFWALFSNFEAAEACVDWILENIDCDWTVISLEPVRDKFTPGEK